MLLWLYIRNIGDNKRVVPQTKERARGGQQTVMKKISPRTRQCSRSQLTEDQLYTDSPVLKNRTDVFAGLVGWTKHFDIHTSYAHSAVEYENNHYGREDKLVN
jgi:hypothetical protein